MRCLVYGLELRSRATTRVPQRENLDFVTVDSVVKVIVNSREMDSPYALCRGI
jgi:hypothetical protein